MIEVTQARTSNHGEPRRHWTIVRGGVELAQMGHGTGPWAEWSILPVDRAQEYRTFSSKAKALEYAAAL